MEIEVINSWFIQGQGIIIDLKYKGQGLPKETCLISKSVDKEWIVKGRLIFNHIADKQIRFENETEISMHLTFNPKENAEISGMRLIENEYQGIFQYLVEPDGHNEKSKQFDRLEIKT